MGKKRETVVLVDEKGRRVGLKDKISAHKNPVPLHKAISVFIFTEDKLLIQKRSKYKKTWPLLWSNTCCSHPYPGESFQKAAERRLFEEMGIASKLKEVFKFIYKEKYNEIWGENEYDAVFVGEYGGRVKPDLKEVRAYKWIDLDRLRRDIEKNSKNYTPWFRLILRRIK